MLPVNPQPNKDEGGTVEGFREYLDANELELALDELEGLGEVNEVPKDYWVNLLAAAKQMKLHKHIEKYQRIIRGS